MNFYDAADYAKKLRSAAWTAGVPTREELASIFPATEAPFKDTQYNPLPLLQGRRSMAFVLDVRSRTRACPITPGSITGTKGRRQQLLRQQEPVLRPLRARSAAEEVSRKNSPRLAKGDAFMTATTSPFAERKRPLRANEDPFPGRHRRHAGRRHGASGVPFPAPERRHRPGHRQRRERLRRLRHDAAHLQAAPRGRRRPGHAWATTSTRRPSSSPRCKPTSTSASRPTFPARPPAANGSRLRPRRHRVAVFSLAGPNVHAAGRLSLSGGRSRAGPDRRRTRACIVVDVHAEATADKYLLAHYLKGRVTAVLGTHTHVPTADEQILPGGTAFQCDVGMTGPYDSILGRSVDRVLVGDDQLRADQLRCGQRRSAPGGRDRRSGRGGQGRPSAASCSMRDVGGVATGKPASADVVRSLRAARPSENETPQKQKQKEDSAGWLSSFVSCLQTSFPRLQSARGASGRHRRVRDSHRQYRSSSSPWCVYGVEAPRPEDAQAPNKIASSPPPGRNSSWRAGNS